MTDDGNRDDNGASRKHRNFIVRIWKWFWGPAGTFSLGVLLIIGIVGGVVFWGGLHWAMELSNTEAFCISCHEMEDHAYKELRETVHYSNPSGVRAICSDCHVPKEWQYKIVRKVRATKDVYHNILGTIDNTEKYEAHRLEMAARVWESMKSTDSRECRNCHSVASMQQRLQKPAAQKKHATMLKDGLTCIDCHQGIAHQLPEDWEETYQAIAEQRQASGDREPES